MIRFERVSVRYPTSEPFREFSLEIATGSTAIVGPSGSGKSTLLRLIAGTQKPSAGRVHIDDVPVVAASWRSAGDGRISLIHQDYRLVPFLTVEQNLQLAVELRASTRDPEEILATLQSVGLDPGTRDRYPDQLSGGEQQRVAIARTLVVRAPVVLADEPTGALDGSNTIRVAEILAEMATRRGLTVVVATHDPVVASRMERTVDLTECDRAVA